MKFAILFSAVLLAGCQTLEWKEGYDPTYDMMMLQQNLQPQPMYYYPNNRNVTCRSRVVGNAVQTNCW